jgi:ATP-dependent DNA helicase RecQ
MAYGLGDVALLRQWIESSEAGEERKRIERQKLASLLGFTEMTGCRRKALIGYFGEAHAGHCGNCDNCLAPPETVDGTEVARKALSCIYRTGERFGAGYVIDVLTGKDDERIRGNGHHRLSTFGIGKDMSVTDWKGLFRQLAAEGLIAVDLERHGAISLTAACRPLLRGEAKFALRKDKRAESTRSLKAERKQRRGETPIRAEDRPLADALRALRRRLAREGSVPPYVIFHDRTLAELALLRPTSNAALAEITGLGEAKIARYGKALIEVIGGFPAGAGANG